MTDDLSEPGEGLTATELGAETLRLSHWLWHPWYAKLWWAAIPIYWLAIGEPTRPSFLDGFAQSGFAIAANIVFIPMTALFFLGIGYLRAALRAGRLEFRPSNSFRQPPSEDVDFSSQGLMSINRFRNAAFRSQANR